MFPPKVTPFIASAWLVRAARRSGKDASWFGNAAPVLLRRFATSLRCKERLLPVQLPKSHSLTGLIDLDRMRHAFLAVKRNRGAAGVDKVSIRAFEANLDDNLAALMFDLKHEDHYCATPLRRVYIPKGDGKLRPLGIPTVRDRVAQEVVRSLLEPIFEPNFSEFSFGFRPRRNAHQAIEALRAAHALGYKWVADADIQAFFDNIPHDLILNRIAERVADGNILHILREFLSAGVMEGLQLRPTTSGTPQGGVISPLLANIVLDLLDQRLTQSGFRFVRYADDFVVLCRSHSQAKQALAFVEAILRDELGLSLSPSKTKVVPFLKGFDFLGFHISKRRISIRDKSIEKLKTRVRLLSTRSHNLCSDVFRELNRVFLGFAHYFAAPFASVADQFRLLDHWVRARIRSMKFKGISRGYNRRWSNKLIARLGLVSLYGFLT
jgi:group II intron reverse transcriptase/maturase